jgi:hypothetical protein
MPLPKDSTEKVDVPFDPTDVRPHLSADPSPSSLAPETDGSLPGPDVEDLLPSFDERYLEDFNGLMFLGALSHPFEWMGHKFVIRTLTPDEYLLIALLTKPYAGTIGESLAYTIAAVALCVDSVDGKPLPTPVMADSEIAWARQRFDFVKARWFKPTIDLVYAEFLGLEIRVNAVLDAMGKASGWEASTLGSDENFGSPSVEDSSAALA